MSASSSPTKAPYLRGDVTSFCQGVKLDTCDGVNQSPAVFFFKQGDATFSDRSAMDLPTASEGTDRCIQWPDLHCSDVRSASGAAGRGPESIGPARGSWRNVEVGVATPGHADEGELKSLIVTLI